MFTLRSLTLTLAFLLTTASASALPANATVSRRALANVVTKCTVPNTAALTFDDGPYVYIYDISKTLIAAGAKGTFFFNGNNFACIYDEASAKRVKYAYDKGHQIANHMWSHPHLNSLNWDQVHDEFWRVEQALQKIVGVTPAFMRPPYGEYNDNVRAVAASRGQTVALWDFDSNDSNGATVNQIKQAYTDLAKRRPSTVLTLNHEVHASSAQQVLPHAIAKLQAAGYRLVTLAECLGVPAYQGPPSTPAARDASWKC